MRYKIKGVFFFFLIALFGIAGIFGLSRGIIWTVQPLTSPTCDGRIMTAEDECIVTNNGFNHTIGYNTQLSNQKTDQFVDRIFLGISIIFVIGIPILIFLKNKKKRK